MDYGYDIYYDSGGNARKAYRICIPDLTCYVPELGERLKSRDISAGGMSLHVYRMEKFALNQTFKISLYVNNDLVLDGLKALVVRIKSDHVAFQFVELSKYQEEILDKMILEAQKRDIDKKKKAEGLHCGLGSLVMELEAYNLT